MSGNFSKKPWRATDRGLRQKKLYRTIPVWVRLMRRRTITPSGCWLYDGHPDGSGYCDISDCGKRVKVHRWIYARVIGPIPAGYQIDHLCRERRCFNPEHLEAVTHAENNRRGAARRARV